MVKEVQWIAKRSVDFSAEHEASMLEITRCVDEAYRGNKFRRRLGKLGPPIPALCKGARKEPVDGILRGLKISKHYLDN